MQGCAAPFCFATVRFGVDAVGGIVDFTVIGFVFAPALRHSTCHHSAKALGGRPYTQITGSLRILMAVTQDRMAGKT